MDWFVFFRQMDRGGEASYSIYLLHVLILNAFRYEVATITEWNPALGPLLQLIVALGAIVGISLVSWTFIEMPCRRALRRLLSNEEKAATAARN
jgi:peptidoglycan/LPS O-acetylase OafA/YrhL